MDGKTLTDALYSILNEVSTSSFMDARTSYDHLYEAACELVSRTWCLTSTQAITTVADQTAYDLNADFLKLYLQNDRNEYVCKLNDGSSDYWLKWRDHQGIVLANNDDSIAIPWNFSIIDKSTLDDPITGTATSSGTLSNGEAILYDTSAPFANVKAGDAIHNTTDGSDGVVISVTSTSELITALFDGTDNDWDSSDAYVIVPGGRKQFILDPPPSTDGYTITLYYLQKPTPVYSSYRAYRFDPDYKRALVMYAAWLYKYRDRDPNFGDAFYKFFDLKCREANRNENSSRNRTGLKFNFKKRSYRDRSYR